MEVCTPTSTPNLQTHTIIYWSRSPACAWQHPLQSVPETKLQKWFRFPPLMLQDEGRLYPMRIWRTISSQPPVQGVGNQERTPLEQVYQKETQQKGFQGYVHNNLQPNMHSHMSIISKHRHILQTNSQCAAVFKDKPQVVYRKCKNLQDLLVRAQVKNTKLMAEETQKIIVPLWDSINKGLTNARTSLA